MVPFDANNWDKRCWMSEWCCDRVWVQLVQCLTSTSAKCILPKPLNTHLATATVCAMRSPAKLPIFMKVLCSSKLTSLWSVLVTLVTPLWSLGLGVDSKSFASEVFSVEVFHSLNFFTRLGVCSIVLRFGSMAKELMRTSSMYLSMVTYLYFDSSTKKIAQGENTQTNSCLNSYLNIFVYYAFDVLSLQLGFSLFLNKTDKRMCICFYTLLILENHLNVNHYR